MNSRSMHPRVANRSMPNSIRPLVLVLIVAGILAVPGVNAPGRAISSAGAAPASLAGSSAVVASAAPATSAAGAVSPSVVHPLDPTDNYTCFKITVGICVSAQNNSPNVVPSPGRDMTSSRPPI